MFRACRLSHRFTYAGIRRPRQSHGDQPVPQLAFDDKSEIARAARRVSRMAITLANGPAPGPPQGSRLACYFAYASGTPASGVSTRNVKLSCRYRRTTVAV